MLKERKKNTELRELLELEAVGVVIIKGRIWWFGHVERKDDAYLVKQCMMMETVETRQRRRRRRPGGIVPEKM